MTSRAWHILLIVIFTAWRQCTNACAGDETTQSGPATEKRFPPLVVPAGFKATLFACDPLIEYPSVISAGPRPGAIFVAVDYMTGLGTEIVRRSEVRLVEDTNGDGYADKATVYAGNFNSIMGLAYHGGTLYVMHAPLLTALRDTNGNAEADERKDIVVGLGLTPEENPVRLHCANGVTNAHDGWLYLALGDHGCDVKRHEGDRLILQGGGILRCRPDGRDLHIYATGLRNIYDVALDAELNAFVRDNENDGGDYKIRVCHSFFGADHGYPYLYYERPSEALRPLADLGLGSSAGGVCYLERHFPAPYRGNLFFCEWGKSLVRYELGREGSSFASPKEIEFAAGAIGDSYGFKPTDVVVQRDGTLMVSDYADGQRPKRGRGRIYHIAHVGSVGKKATPRLDTDPLDDPLAMLDSESYFERCDAQRTIEHVGEKGIEPLIEALASGRVGRRGRLHAIWILAHVRGSEAIEPLMAIAKSDPEPVVRAQAVRAIADLADPLLARHRLDTDPGDEGLAKRLADLGNGNDRRVELEILVALGRLRWSGTAEWLKSTLKKPDATLSHAAMRALRQSHNWPAVLSLLDAPDNDPLREIALRAAGGQYDAILVDGLLERLSQKGQCRPLAARATAVRLREYSDCLARVYKKPGPWVYWDYRPKPRPENQAHWERTEAIADALNGLLSHSDPDVRLAVLNRMKREHVPASLKALGKWLQEESEPLRVGTVLDYLRDQPASGVGQHLEPVIRSPVQSPANRLTALALFVRGIDKQHADTLFALCQQLEDGPILAEALRLIGKSPTRSAVPLLTGKLVSTKPEVRAAAIETLGELRAVEGRDPLVVMLADPDPQVRRAAACAAAKLMERRAIEPLIKMAADSDVLVRAASLDSLRLLKEPRAVPLAVAALVDRQTEQIALQSLRDLGGPEQAGVVTDMAKRNPSLEMLTSAVQALTTWGERGETGPSERQRLDRAVAEIHGANGNLIRWNVSGPDAAAGGVQVVDNAPSRSRVQFATGTEGRVAIAGKRAEKGHWFHARTEIVVLDPTDVEFLASSSGPLQVWLDGKSIYHRKIAQSFHIDSDRFWATLANGSNRLVVSVEASSPEAAVEFHLRFRRKSAIAQHERLAQSVLSRTGNPMRGREIFFNKEKSLCLTCHRVDDQGERIGPELTGLGSRFSRIYLAESILEPSRAIAPSFGTLAVRLESGEVLSGVKVAENEITITLADNRGQKQVVSKSDIDEQKASWVSTMPEGLEKRITEEEFVDLIAFLASLKETRPPYSPSAAARRND
jgi:putative heme-binding domain-containing protein